MKSRLGENDSERVRSIQNLPFAVIFLRLGVVRAGPHAFSYIALCHMELSFDLDCEARGNSQVP